MSKAFALAAALMACLLTAASASSQPSGFVYALVNNSSGINTLAGFALDSNGTLTALPGFPIGTGGNGPSFTNFALSLTYDAANQRLYAVNSGSRTVSAWTVNTASGAITQMPFSPLALPTTPTPLWDCILTNPSGSLLVIGNIYSVASYVITANTATAAAGSPFSTSPSDISSCAFSQDGAFYYSGGGNGTLFTGHAVDQSSGVLTPLPGAPFDAVFGEPLGYVTDSSGRFFATTFENKGALVFTTSGGIPIGVTGNPFVSAPANLGAVKHGLLHPAGFYLTTSDFGYVGVYRINGTGSATTLTAVPGYPVATGQSFSRISILDAKDNLVVTANTATRNATIFKFNVITGALTRLGVTPANSFGSTGDVTGLAWAAACPLPTITAQPASQTIASGASTTLGVTASGCGALSYQWYQGVSGGTANPIGGATASSYVTPPLDAHTNYWVSVSNVNGSTFSDTANISVQFTDTHSADPTLTTGLSVVLAGHIVNLRDRINAILTAHSQSTFTWDETLTTQMTAIKAAHVNELRNAISTLYAALGLPAPTFLYSPVAPGDVIRARTISEFRALVTAVE